MHTYRQIIARLKRKANTRNVAGMARFGINTKATLGISVNDLRVLAKEIGKNHELAQRLWRSGIHEARILAALIDEPAALATHDARVFVVELPIKDAHWPPAMDQGGVTPLLRAYAISWPRCSCPSGCAASTARR